MTRSEYLRRQAELVREERIESDGAAVRLLTAGAESPRAVLLLTGVGRGARSDTGLLMPMLARRHRVAALELADLGDPWLNGPAAVRASLDALGAEEAVLIGHSLGAAVALAAGDRRVSALALVAGWLRPTERLLRTARLWPMLPPDAQEEAARLLAVRSATASAPWSAGAAGMLAASAQADASAAASDCRVPALVVGCSADAVVGVEGAEALLGAIDDARYAVLDSGHAVLTERPAELLAVLEHFLADPHRDPAGSVLARTTV
jgi:pimeloyl-ACP methyl ester carboxylesterase